MRGWRKCIQFCNRRPARMKSLVLVLVLVGAASLIASRPSPSEIPSLKDGELKEDIKTDVFQRRLLDCKSRADNLGSTIKTPLADIALTGSSTDSQLSYLHHQLLRRFGHQSGAHSFSKHINLPHSNLSITRSGADAYTDC